jgi:nitric oxide reductase subunit C
VKRLVVFLVCSLSLLLTACGRSASGAVGDAVAGRALFHQTTIGQAPACSACHSTEPGKVIIGPSLAGVAERAGQRIPNVSAVDYLRQSILEPNRYVVEGFSAGVMYQHFEDALTDTQVDDLIAYLLTLK